ncbi:putative metallopeptidase, putative,metallo-peptidase, clan MP, family M67 [Trypanosoma conorhini]|uniref:Putative metallopeptidase, putative,metallo-peptidase, clan MP, family M67 n=1 Tax=Trypanosoma conorhini TaxID=83891 RepID=A0A3R7LF43_9TRYP|nr:putative metallopeptidase, putative,metallo-peptidase, clan MP, family M67 [Trypanosoma conorhini]RNF27165.1 putative metallopeptidase, putative,metallo-peptidase, clan MP, family M67 [Trypanosoma conorhini]
MRKTAPLEKLVVADTVIQACLAHAFTTEQEEVMGLLLGDVTLHDGGGTATATPTGTLTAAAAATPAVSGGATAPRTGVTAGAAALDTTSPIFRKRANVWGTWVLQRSVRRSDRVEIAPEMLASATEEANRYTQQVGRQTRVIGWYHSHPRITPYPSQVDLRSQGAYQQLESGWVGLIFSVFYSDATNRNSVSIHCFRTGPGETHEKVEMEIVPVGKMPLRFLPPCEVTCHLLHVFRAEVAAAVEMVRRRCNNAPDAMAAAFALQVVQLYTLDKLIAQPTLRHLKSSIASLERQVERLERELSAPKP